MLSNRQAFLLFGCLFLYFSLYFLSPSVCFPQSSTKAEVDALYQKWRAMHKQGRYVEALNYSKELVPAGEKAFGKDHPNVAIFLDNLAQEYVNLGDYTKAEPICKRSLAIREKVLGPEHPAVSSSLNNLAILYEILGNYAKAESLHKRALANTEKVLGPEHPDVTPSLNNLAHLYYNLGDYTKAVPLLKRSLAIREKAFGPEHSSVSTSLNNLARMYHSLGDYTKAESLYIRSLAIREKAIGPEHPSMSTSLNNLAWLYAASDNFSRAHDLVKKAQQIDDKLIDQVMGFTNEAQKMKFLSIISGNLHVFISLVNQYLSSNLLARKDAIDVWLKRKGVILQAQKRFQEALIYSDDPEVVNAFQALAKTRARLSQIAFRGPGKEGVETYKKWVTDLEARKGRLEARLSQLSHAFAVQKKIAMADSETVAMALPKDSALLEFARIKRFNFKAKGKEKQWLAPRYLVFVLHAGKGDRVGMIDLGDAINIDKAIAEFKKEISNTKKIRGTGVIEASRKIYDLVFAKIKKELGDVKNIFISPDGNLNLIPFEVLQSSRGRFLTEDFTFNYLAAGRDVLRFGEIKEKGNISLLIGDPDFDLENTDKDSTITRLALRRKSEIDPNQSMDMRGFQFTRIPGTREEVQAIYDFFGDKQAELYIDKEALEEVLYSRDAPSILHIATHGFFLRDLELADIASESLDRGIVVHPLNAPSASGKKAKMNNPLLLSGIVLAGANNAIQSGDTERSDGIVTAEKILGLRLRGTDMVVLSACDTGLGEVKAGEGVYGLRRAFLQAGTRSLVMSLWSVPDVETKELMVEFYKNIKSRKMNRCKALRLAALREMKIVEERYGTDNPLFWGAFIFLGEP